MSVLERLPFSIQPIVLGLIDPINSKVRGRTKKNELDSASISNQSYVVQTIFTGKRKLATKTCFYIRISTILN